MKKDFINSENIEGYLFSLGNGFNELSVRTAGEKSKNPGSKYIAGDVDIAVDEEGLNVITIHYNYVAPLTKTGATNNTYTTLKTLIDNPERTWIQGGKENAYKVRASRVSIGVNDFIASDGKKVAALRNERGFISIVNDLKPEKDRNRFEADMLITKVTRIEADPDKNINEDYGTISGCIFGYGPVLFPATFTVRDEKGLKFFEDTDASPSEPYFTKVWGKVESRTSKITRKEDSAWGETKVDEASIKTKEYCITGTKVVPYDFGDENVLTAEEVNTMVQDRQLLLAEIEKRYEERKNQKNNEVDFSTITSNDDFKF